MKLHHSKFLQLFVIILFLFIFSHAQPVFADQGKRTTISLDGEWQIAEGYLQSVPLTFSRTIRVPGLVDMAKPPFEEVGFKSNKRQAFWYKRKFTIDNPVPKHAFLKINKAMFGSKVILNGRDLGQHFPSFTPGWFDIKNILREGENELLISVGSYYDEVPKPIPSGWDYEKERFTPGIFDSVELVLSGEPYIKRIQAVPDLKRGSVTVHAWLAGIHTKTKPTINLVIYEATSGQVVAEGKCKCDTKYGSTETTGRVTIPIKNCHLWSPEDPFLYELKAFTDGDSINTKFGMRSFHLDAKSGRAILNGRPYFMRGSNVTLYRFFEDSARGDNPWNEAWVRQLHKKFKDMHWNTIRYCIGFPPEIWYQIADEEGILIQDEFPIWNMDAKFGDYDARELAEEYKDWMQERWNHPCVVIWDACNETRARETGNAIRMVRKLDYSNRPWDNGWSKPVSLSDSRELHPYHFQDPNFKLSQIAKDPGTLEHKGGIVEWQAPGNNAIIVNEYGWLWLNRDGTPTALTRELYKNLLGPDSTTQERRELYARYMAAETEFWRSHRACAGVLHFCALGYSRPREGDSPQAGATSDHWLNVDKLQWEPEFYDLVRDSFAPIGLMIDAFAESYPAKSKQIIPVPVINDLDSDWNGNVQMRILKDGKAIKEEQKPCRVPAFAREVISFTLEIPSETGAYQMEAQLLGKDANKPLNLQKESTVRPVRSLRNFKVP